MEVLAKWDKKDQRRVPWLRIRMAIEETLRQMRCGAGISWDGEKEYTYHRSRFYNPLAGTKFVYDEQGARQNLLPGSPYLAHMIL